MDSEKASYTVQCMGDDKSTNQSVDQSSNGFTIFTPIGASSEQLGDVYPCSPRRLVLLLEGLETTVIEIPSSIALGHGQASN